MMASRFKKRSDEIEIMDDLDCKGEVVYQTLRELEFINRWLGGNAVTLEGAKQLTQGFENNSLTIADLGCGGGDTLKLLAVWGRKNKMTLQLTGMDANPHIIEFARNNCRDYPEISFETVDIFSHDFQQRTYDIVLGTLFFHHFHTTVLIDFFSRLKKQVRMGFVLNDIHRHWLAFHSIRLLTRLLSKSPMVKFDAPLSVLRAFTKKELVIIFANAGVEPIRIGWKWAFRWLAVYRREA